MKNIRLNINQKSRTLMMFAYSERKNRWFGFDCVTYCMTKYWFYCE